MHWNHPLSETHGLPFSYLDIILENTLLESRAAVGEKKLHVKTELPLLDCHILLSSPFPYLLPMEALKYATHPPLSKAKSSHTHSGSSRVFPVRSGILFFVAMLEAHSVFSLKFSEFSSLMLGVGTYSLMITLDQNLGSSFSPGLSRPHNYNIAFNILLSLRSLAKVRACFLNSNPTGIYLYTLNHPSEVMKTGRWGRQDPRMHVTKPQLRKDAPRGRTQLPFQSCRCPQTHSWIMSYSRFSVTRSQDKSTRT